MTTNTKTSVTLNPRTTGNLTLVPITLVLGAVAVLFFSGRGLYAMAAVGTVLAGLLMLHPRLAFYLFIASWSFWMPQRLTYTFAIHPFDLLLAITAAASLLDYFLRPPARRSALVFDIPFLALVAATLISAIFAFKPSMSIVPTFRIIVIYLAFRVSIKFGREIGVRKVLQFYLAIVGLLSLHNLYIFITNAGQIRAFGLALLGYESLSMTGLPIAVAFALWASDRRERMTYLATALVIGLGIIATQARGPLLTVFLVTPILIWISWKKGRLNPKRLTTRTARLLLVGAAVVGAVTIGLSTTLLAGSWERYQMFLASFSDPQGTIALRLTLWGMAIDTWLQHPLTGIGIGNFRVVHELLTEVKLLELHRFVKGMSAHHVLLHYLAETGLLGAGSLLALSVMGLRRARQHFHRTQTNRDRQVSAALYIGMIIFFVTLFYMRAWTWGQGGYIMALLFGLTAAWVPPPASDH